MKGSITPPSRAVTEMNLMPTPLGKSEQMLNSYKQSVSKCLPPQRRRERKDGRGEGEERAIREERITEDKK